MFELDRRTFLRLLALSGAAPGIAGLVGCGDDLVTDPVFSLANTGGPVAARPPLSLGRASGAELDVSLRVLSGRLPRDLEGSVYVMGSVPFPDEGAPVIVGDGIVHKYTFGNGDVAYRSRQIKTPSWHVDQATRSEGAFATAGFARMNRDWGVCNYCNTALVPMADNRLMATMDAGRPFELDPVSAEVVTAVGRNDEWRPALPAGLLGSVFPLVQTTAHPVWDQHTGEWFSVNFGGGMLPGTPSFLTLVLWSGDGDLRHVTLVDEDGETVGIDQNVHQIGVTQDYIVVMDTAFVIEAGQLFGTDELQTQKPESIVYIVRRADLTPGATEVMARRVAIPREAAHFLVDYDNPGGRITLHLSHNVANDPSEWTRAGEDLFGGGTVPADLGGLLVAGTDRCDLGRHIIDGERALLLDESVLFSDDTYGWGIALWANRGTNVVAAFESLYWCGQGFSPELLTRRVVEAYADHPLRHHAVNNLPRTAIPATLFRLNVRDMQVADGFTFPPGRICLSPQFIPRPGSTSATDGYVSCTMISDDRSDTNSSGDEIWIFDAANLAQGPLCRLGHPEMDLGFTLHTTFIHDPKPRTATYNVDVMADHAAGLATLSEEQQALFARVMGRA